MNARALSLAVRERLSSLDIPDPTFEAELLVRLGAGLPREAYFANPTLAPGAAQDIERLAFRRAQREPFAYLSGVREFYALPVNVSPAVLIPRPETELLVEIALGGLQRQPDGLVVDVGTGSGAIAVAIATNAPRARVVGTEISRAALRVACENALQFAPAIHMIRADLAGPVARADVVVANLPYIPTGLIPSLEPEVRDWEPRLALDGGRDGLHAIRRLIDDCSIRLRPRLLALEVMDGQAAQVATLLVRCGAAVATHPDLAGIERVVTARWP